MPKNIVLLSDGTGNSAKKLFKTNVWRLYQALDLTALDTATPPEPKQIAYYDDGVGTASFLPLAILGGAFGWGTKRNVLDIYTYLCRHYTPGDNIYLFGFSRGAFTARLLTGLIADQGLVTPTVKIRQDGKKKTTVAEGVPEETELRSEAELRRLAAEAFRDYRRNNYNQRRPITLIFRALRDLFLAIWYALPPKKKRYNRDENIRPYDPDDRPHGVRIKFLGLWDTVSAYGLPFDELTHAWDLVFPLSFPDRRLRGVVECAYHAMAIDDERLTFHPQVYSEDEKDYPVSGKDRVPLGNRLTQVWFPGMHSNVGGGYPDDGLAGVPLNWIIKKGKDAGMLFCDTEFNRLEQMNTANGKQYDSRQGLGGAYRYAPRNLQELMEDEFKPRFSQNNENEYTVRPKIIPKIHYSVLERIRADVDGYAPIGLPRWYDVIERDGAITTETNNSIWPEKAEDARARCQRQERVWDLVWWKRLLYFISVLLVVLLIVLPKLPSREWPVLSLWGIVDLVRYGVGTPLSRFATYIPGGLGRWLAFYGDHPGLFIVMILLLSVVLYFGSRLQGRIFDLMRTILHAKDEPVVGAKQKTAKEMVAEDASGGPVRWLRTNNGVRRLSQVWKENFVPVLVVLLLILVLLPRWLFALFDASGVQTRASVVGPKTGPEFSEFRTSDVAWRWDTDGNPDTIEEVTEGERYRIILTVKEPWLDSTIPANPVDGVRSEDLTAGMKVLRFYRRHMVPAYFKPIARIGYYGNEEFPLEFRKPNKDELPETVPSDKTYVAYFTAEKTGALYLFVNDAIDPRFWSSSQYFYTNNKGTADVSVAQWYLDGHWGPVGINR
jgi:uncharacterized protein (DUF2235 family)